MLHLVNKSPFSANSFDSCIKFAQKGAPILLLEDGVIGAMAGSSIESKIVEAMVDRPVYVLKEDLMARGITKLVPGIQEVDYAGFVDLVEQHNTQSWT